MKHLKGMGESGYVNQKQLYEYIRQLEQAAPVWRDISQFPKNAEYQSSWEVIAIYDGVERHWICKWFGDVEGFSMPGFSGFKVTHFCDPRPLPTPPSADTGE